MVSQSLFTTFLLPLFVVARPVVPRDAVTSGTSCGQLVIVQNGDSCQGIASQNGIDQETLLRLNPKLQCSNLEAGTTQVCVRDVPIGAPTSGGVYLDSCRLGSSACELEVSPSSGGKYIDPGQTPPQSNPTPAVAPHQEAFLSPLRA